MKCCMQEKIADPKKKALSDKINAIGWALFLVMRGGLLLMPKGKVPESAWLIGAGIILVGVNVVRYLTKIKLCGCTLLVGAILLIAGICGLYGIEFPIFPVLLILAGIGIVVGLITKKKC